MALRIDTFDNVRGGNTLYKALTHPHAAEPARALLARLAARGADRDRRSRMARRKASPRFSGWTGSRSPASMSRTCRAIGATVLGRRCRADHRAGRVPRALGACRRVRRRAADRPAPALSARRRADLQPRCDAHPGGAADQSPRLSRPAQLRDQFCAVSRHRQAAHAARHGELLVRLRFARGDLLADAVRRRWRGDRRMGRDLRRHGRRDHDRQPPGARAIRPRRLCRPALHPCRRRGRPRHRQIRARHLWRIGRRTRDGGAVLHP